MVLPLPVVLNFRLSQSIPRQSELLVKATATTNTMRPIGRTVAPRHVKAVRAPRTPKRSFRHNTRKAASKSPYRKSSLIAAGITHRPTTAWSPLASSDNDAQMGSSARGNGLDAPDKIISRLNTQPARTPANACNTSLRTHRHGTGPIRGATALLYGSLIHYYPPAGASPPNPIQGPIFQNRRMVWCRATSRN
jgi:hypothetical protein